MEIGLITVGFIIVLIGLIGAFLPILPGPPVAFLSFVLLLFVDSHERTNMFWVVFVGLLVFTIIVQVLDYLIPAMGTKKMGGSKWGVRGTYIGLIIGVIFSPFGLVSIFLCPMLGAIAGEYIYMNKEQAKLAPADATIKENKPSIGKALKAGMGAFLGFLTGTALKFATALVIAGFYTYFAVRVIQQIA